MQVTVSIPDAYMQNPDRLAQQIESEFITELLQLWKQYLLPAFRRITPYRTGRLRRSLHIVREGNKLTIAVKPQGFYWHMQDGLPLRYREIYNRLLPQMVDIAMQRTRERLGI